MFKKQFFQDYLRTWVSHKTNLKLWWTAVSEVSFSINATTAYAWRRWKTHTQYTRSKFLQAERNLLENTSDESCTNISSSEVYRWRRCFWFIGKWKKTWLAHFELKFWNFCHVCSASVCTDYMWEHWRKRVKYEQVIARATYVQKSVMWTEHFGSKIIGFNNI